jgi:hypothetical protein
MLKILQRTYRRRNELVLPTACTSDLPPVVSRGRHKGIFIMTAGQVLQTTTDQNAAALQRFIGIGEVHFLFRQKRAQMFVVVGDDDDGAGGTIDEAQTQTILALIKKAKVGPKFLPDPERTCAASEGAALPHTTQGSCLTKVKWDPLQLTKQLTQSVVLAASCSRSSEGQVI